MTGNANLNARVAGQGALPGAPNRPRLADHNADIRMVLLAGMYQRGEGKPQDPARAARLYRDALAIPGLSMRHREIAQAALAAKS